jgi:hydrophobe/amphiphile efflux-1 (HAE1) family protein
LIRRPLIAMLALVAFFLAAGGLFRRLPAGFLPDEDQGVFLTSVRLPDGASVQRTKRVLAQVEDILHSIPGVVHVTTLGGTDIATSTSNSNVATIFSTLTPWDERRTKDLQLSGILAQSQRKMSQVKDAIVFSFGLPPILGLSNAGGFEFMLEDRAGGDTEQLAQAADLVADTARQRPELGGAQSSFRNGVPQYKVDLDTEKAQTLGIPVTDVYNALQTFLGGLYINDFNRFSRTWRVTLEAEPEFRNTPEDVNRFYVRTANGDMVPLSTLVKVSPMTGPEVIYRYNRFRTAKIIGQNAPGYSSGQAAAVMDQIGEHNLPNGFAYEWTGTVFQQKLSEGKEGFLFGFAATLVFLFLAALYESWAIPFAVVLSVPLGLFGALLAVYLRDYDYDIYTQIGIVTLIGLAAKNAILIVEYARLRRQEGMTIQQAALEAARLRLRPILMTSFAFILGVVPLVIATGAGGASRRALGTTVFGGMNAATLLAIFIVPVLYVVVDRIAEGRGGKKSVDQREPVTVAGGD